MRRRLKRRGPSRRREPSARTATGFITTIRWSDAKKRYSPPWTNVTGGNELVWGVDREELRALAGLTGSPLFDHLLEKGRSGGKLFFKGGKVRAGSDELELTGEMKASSRSSEAFFAEAGWKFPMKGDLLKAAAGDEKKMNSCHPYIAGWREDSARRGRGLDIGCSSVRDHIKGGRRSSERKAR